MKKLLLLFCALFVMQMTFGQLTGTKSIPGDYATIEAAVAALNSQGVGAGGVTFNVASGHTELITAPISLTATGTLANPIIFQKSGATANPLITAYAGGANLPNSAVQDGIWNLVGSDYVTINGIDLLDPNVTNPETMEYGYALFKADLDNGCQYNTIKNCVVTLSRENVASGSGPSVEGSKAINVVNATVTAQTTALTPTLAEGANSYNMFYGNTLQNCNYGIVLNGFAAATPFTSGDFGNDVGGTSGATGNTILNYGGGTGSTNPSAGIRANFQWGVNISYNTINNNNGLGVNHPSTLRGIYAQAGVSANATISNNNLNIKGGGTTSQVAMIENAIGSTAAGNTVNINNNILTGEYLSATSGVFYGIYSSSSAANVNIEGNSVTNLSYSNVANTGTGANYPIWNSGAATFVNIDGNTVNNVSRIGTTGGTTIGIYVSSGANQTVTDNTVSNLSIDGTGTTSTMYGIQTSTGTIVVENNTIHSLTCIKTTGSGVLYGMYNIASPTNENYNNNLVYNLTHNGTGTMYGIYAFTTTGVRTMSGNTIHTLTTGGTTIAGLHNSSSSPSVFNNKVYNIRSNSAAAPTVSGILQAGVGTAGVANIYNNLIGDIKAPNAATNTVTSPAVRGINITTTTGSSAVNVSFNTVYLNASSTGANFGSAGLFVTTSTTATTAALTLRNNIIVNKSTPAGTGLTVAYQRSSTALNNYTSLSDNNLFFAGTPGATQLIFYDATNLVQTLAEYKTLVTPRDASSITEDANFISVSGASPDFLHINEAIATQIESGGIPVAGISDDFDGQPRHATTPDIGADEFTGIALDATPPNIVLTPLSNTSSTGNRVLITTITDATGVPTAGIGLPVLYWKINAGSYSPVQATYLGGNQYSFTFGAGVGLNDVVSYYIVAQDLVTPTPNIGIVPSGGASGLTANPPAASTPPTTPFSYTIVGTLAGTYSVGVGQTYPTLTAAIADLNLKEVIAPVTFELWDADYSTSETFPLIIYPYVGMDVTRPVTFKPKAGVTATVTGAPATGILVLYGVDYIILDGSNSGGDDKSLTWENTSTSANSYTIGVFNYNGDPASNCTIKNCIIKASSQVTTNTFAIILNAAGGGYDNIVIDNNTIFSARYGIQFAGVSAAPATNGKITNNIIGSADNATAIQYRGVTLSYADNTLISGNEIMGAPNGNTNTYQTGVYIMAGSTNTAIRNNKIHDFYYTGTSGYGCYGIYYGSSATTPTLIYNNLIYNIKSDGDPGSQNYSPTGIYVFSGGNMEIFHNTIYMTGATLSASYTLSYSSCISIYSGITGLDIRNNILKNSMTTASGSGSNKTYAIYCASANTVFTNIDYNDYFVDGLNPSIGFLGGAQATLADWKIATAQDFNSQNIDPVFVAPTDLMPTNMALNNLGLYLTQVPKDYAGVSRTNPPDMGAYEFGVNPEIVTLAASEITCEQAVLNGTIDANGLSVNSFFDYGLTDSYGSSVAASPATVTGSEPVAISATLTGLAENVTYHFRARGLTTDGVMVYGDDFTFTTNASGAPVVVTTMATDIGDTWVTLNGTVNPNCDIVNAYFEYGTTVAYGSTVATTPNNFGGGGVTLVSAYQASLLVGQTYHYRLVAVNSYGTTYGGDMTFTTGANPPVVITDPASNIGNFTARLNGTVSASNQNTTVTFEYGLTTSYGTIVSGVPGLVTGNTPTAVYADISGLAYNTTYHFRVVGQNPAGTAYGADMVFTTLCPVPEAAGAISGPTSVCQATSGHVYTVPPINFAYAGYVWTVPAGGTITNGANTNSITVSYNSSAVSGNVTVYGTSVCGNGTPSSLPVTVNPLPVPSITGPDLACITSTYTYSTEAGMTDYVWTVSAGGQIMSGAGTNTVTVKWNNTGAQSVSVNYTSAAGCPAAAPTTMNVSVGNLPSPTITGSNMLCMGSGLHVYTTEGGFSDYVWTVSAGGTIVSGQGTYQIEVNWTTPGSKTVTVNYDNSYGCSAFTPASFAVTVMALPGNAGAISGTSGLCAGTQSVSYSVAAIPDALDYIWTLPSGATIVAGENTNSIQVDFALDAASGDITVYAENLCGAGQPSPAYNVTVNPIPETPVVTIDEFFVLTSSAAIGNQWYFNGDMIDGANGQYYQAEEEGLYWTIVTLNDCASEASNQIEVIFTGLDELNGTIVTIYPVPNNGVFTVSIVSKEMESFSISVFNHLGVKVYEDYEMTVSGKIQKVINLGTHAAGIYTMVIKSNNANLSRRILITE